MTVETLKTMTPDMGGTFSVVKDDRENEGKVRKGGKGEFPW